MNLLIFVKVLQNFVGFSEWKIFENLCFSQKVCISGQVYKLSGPNLYSEKSRKTFKQLWLCELLREYFLLGIGSFWSYFMALSIIAL